MPSEGCGDDGKAHCVASAAEETRNLQHLKKLTQDVYKRKCAAGNGAYCDGNPVEIAAFTIAMWTGGALLESFVLGGGAADASLAVFWKGVQSCISNAVCRGVTGMVGGGGALANSATNPIGATGDIGEEFLKQFGGESQAYYPTTQGARYIDQVINGMAYESKVGYVSLSEDISLQVSKDVELLTTGQVNSVSWVFSPSPVTGSWGPSGPLYNLLTQNGIQVFFANP